MISSVSKTEAAVLITYSSVIPEGAVTPAPSKLSLLAALASRESLTEFNGELWIAGERSYKDFDCTTGGLLIENHRELLPTSCSPIQLIPGSNRFINTPYQVEALVERCHVNEVEKLKIIGWGFHGLRVLRLLKAYDPSIVAEYSRVEGVLSAMNPFDLQENLEAMGFAVDFGTIMQTGLKQYRRREWLTRQALLFNRKGKVINWLSQRREVGRYDDLDARGKAVMGTTKRPEHLPVLDNDIVEKTAFVD